MRKHSVLLTVLIVLISPYLGLKLSLKSEFVSGFFEKELTSRYKVLNDYNFTMGTIDISLFSLKTEVSEVNLSIPAVAI